VQNLRYNQQKKTGPELAYALGAQGPGPMGPGPWPRDGAFEVGEEADVAKLA
jgi:hypothetical protein